jgi:7-carboxy-7-deazaguanine synthase
MSIIKNIKSDRTIQNFLGKEFKAGDERVVLAEKPFITIQGEGPNMGKHTLFIRFFGCNLANSCGVDWCDSGHSFYTNEEGLDAPKEDRIIFHNIDSFWEYIFETNRYSNFNNIVFTGGEPMLWQHVIVETINKLKQSTIFNVSVEIETNGTIPIEDEYFDAFRVVHFNISPKVHVVSSFLLIKQLKESLIEDWILKFVWDNKENVKKIKECLEKYEIPNYKVYLMPEGVSREQQVKKMKDIAEYCVNNGYNFSPRLHVLIWDLAKGV